MTAGRCIEGIETEVKGKIHFEKNVYVVYFSVPISFDGFFTRLKDVCKLAAGNTITVKIIDDEGDPCTVLDQSDLDEIIHVITENGASDMLIHVFNGVPPTPGAPCIGEDKNVYRRGARRWNKFYNIHGHRFQVKRSKRADCALCQDSIWGIGKGGLKCVDCGMFVHKRCHKFVRKFCTKEVGNYPQTPVIQKTTVPASEQVSPINGKTKGFEARIEAEQINGQKRPQHNGLDDFNMLKVIGRGSYAKVVQAEHKVTKQIYAIKIIKKSMFLEEDDLDWIQTEKSVFETASNHPFLVGLHSCFQSDSRLFFVIEFIPGGDLMFHMQHQQRLPEDHARFYSAEIILALNFLHSRNIIYRDLKLDNVLLDQHGHVKLTDFGMCKENIGPNDVTNTFCGTPNYIAPEILRGEDYGFSVDYWALGVLMYEMMAGRSPFQLPGNENEENAEDTLFHTILERQIRIPRHLSVRAANVLKGFLNKDPTLRLGCKKDIEEGMGDIKMNGFFRDNIDWAALERRQVLPPYNPNVAGDRDLRRFDVNFTNESPRLTPDDPAEIARLDQSEFEGFEYVNPLQLEREDVV
ncbi:unnamed protein product [Bursaphelenchus okinawaensis]|uniref:Protein kinase C n=1 Tax=Bursaphelenchus okinawaensis TaxID=465554 RepID=A0A811KBI4_9BILA|nr:unnamed protein product [Bursaphelenchus okinawaensis]CAG9097397.1 unnamed protein product [Bursaphelenchus okinawaensis]